VIRAFLFPGQGSEAPGMGGEALRQPGPVRSLLERASRSLEMDLIALADRGGPALVKTEVSQGVLVSVGVGLAIELQMSGVAPDALAGHSVGELAAFCIAGCVAPEEAVDLALERGRLMAEAARRSPGGMAALQVTAEEDARAAIALGNGAGHVEIAAHNGPAEYVLTGDKAALAAVASRFPTVPLPVAGPWHSRAMSEAERAWRVKLRQVEWRRPAIPLVANATGRFVAEGDDPVELLAGQLTRPVLWAESLQTLHGMGVTTWHVFGPGRVIRGLCRSNLGRTVEVVMHDGMQPAEVRA
jgi:[acyl-carrier-protein] S-malonyltransferase